MKKTNKLELWQRRLSINETAYAQQLDKMDHREELYRGTHELKQAVTGKKSVHREASHVRNVVAEMVESMVDTNLPQPKISPRRQIDEQKAKIVEDMLRNELDRMPFEEMNDQQERTVPIQGAAFWLVEWDDQIVTKDRVGDVTVSVLHPKQVIPQAGVYTSIEDMDYIIVKLAQTKEYIRRKYGVDVQEEGEEEPQVRGLDEVSEHADDLVTQYVAYYRNENGGIGKYSWVGETELEDLDDYQARRLKRCAKCGASEVEAMLSITRDGEIAQTQEGEYPLDEDRPAEEPKKTRKGTCPFCGSRKWEESNEDYEEVVEPITRSDGSVIEGGTAEIDENGEPKINPTRIPYYKPNIFPIIMQRNVSVFGQLLGDSDVDKIADQQNTINRLSTALNDKLLKGGSYMILPRDAKVGNSDEDMKEIRVEKPDQLAMIGVKNMDANVESDIVYLENVYEQAKQALGITDSFLGRKDTTATSGTAKQFAAAQSAGRLESKRVMKHAAYARLFEAIFKFKLAYTDEIRPVMARDVLGHPAYGEFNRYDFLEQNGNGDWYWNTDFLFACDTAASLATNRAEMWRETLNFYQIGAFGDPAQPDTATLLWQRLEGLHYPGASEIKAALEVKVKQQQMMQQQAMQQQQAMMQQQMQAQQSQRQHDEQRELELALLNNEQRMREIEAKSANKRREQAQSGQMRREVKPSD